MMPNQFDPFTALRLKSMFGGGGGTGPYNPDNSTVDPNSMPPQMQSQIAQDPNNQLQPQPYDPASRMAQLYRPQNVAQQQYMGTLGNMPSRNQYKPGLGRKIAAFIGGMGTGTAQGMYGGQPVGYQANPNGAMQVASNIANGPYNQAMGDWQNKAQAQGLAANMEMQGNKGQLGMAENTIKNELTNRERDIQQQREKDLRNKSDEINTFQYTKLAQQYDIKLQDLENAQKRLAANSENQQAKLELSRAQLEAVQARHQLDLAEKQKEFRDTYDRLLQQHRDLMDQANSKLEEAKKTNLLRFGPLTKTTTMNGGQNGQPISRTETTSRQPMDMVPSHQQGSNEQVKMIGKDGKAYLIGKDKVAQALKDGFTQVNQ